jgi:hypothetical protein
MSLFRFKSLTATLVFLLAAHPCLAQQTVADPSVAQSDDLLESDESRAQADDEIFFASKRKTWLEVWGFHNAQGHDSASNTIQPRLYHSFALGRTGAQAVTRLDTSFNSNSGPKYGNGGGGGEFNPGNTRWTLAAFTPEVAQNLTFGGGFRMVMPTGYNNPRYSSAQWAIGPQLAMTYAPKNAGAFTFFSPLVRYMMGTTPVASNATLMRALEIYPALGFQLTPKLKLAMWDETGIAQSQRNGKWFVPIDAMLTYSFDNHWGTTVGASAPVVNENFSYFWNVYSRIIYNF